MTNGLWGKVKKSSQPNEKVLLDICQTPGDMRLALSDFFVTFGLIVLGYLASCLFLSCEYIYGNFTRGISASNTKVKWTKNGLKMD